MDCNPSSVCDEAATLNEQQQQKSTKSEASMPLYATVIPSNARKNRQQKQQ